MYRETAPRNDTDAASYIVEREGGRGDGGGGGGGLTKQRVEQGAQIPTPRHPGARRAPSRITQTPSSKAG